MSHMEANMENSNWLRDAVERVVRTVIAIVVGAGLAAFTEKIKGTENVSLDTITAALAAAYSAGASALMSWLATLAQNTVSPASFAKRG